MEKYVIISRHSGAIAWLNAMGYVGETISHFDVGNIEPGVTYIGTLPIGMVNEILLRGGKFIVLSLPSIAFEERGSELSPNEMSYAGANLYAIQSLSLREIDPYGTICDAEMWYDRSIKSWTVIRKNMIGGQIGCAEYYHDKPCAKQAVDEYKLMRGTEVPDC